jgi:hypothetical protein
LRAIFWIEERIDIDFFLFVFALETMARHNVGRYDPQCDPTSIDATAVAGTTIPFPICAWNDSKKY